jgi:hypothetical protein
MSDNHVTHNNAVIGIILFRVPSVRAFQFVTKKDQYIPRPARQPAPIKPVVPVLSLSLSFALLS